MYPSRSALVVIMLGKPSRCSSTFKLSGNTRTQSATRVIFTSRKVLCWKGENLRRRRSDERAVEESSRCVPLSLFVVPVALAPPTGVRRVYHQAMVSFFVVWISPRAWPSVSRLCRNMKTSIGDDLRPLHVSPEFETYTAVGD